MLSILHKADTRGHANHGWLNSWHSFSFASYYNPERIHFGALRVLNDDTVAAGMGFGKHPHDNMEIISIPLDGDLEHEDNMGNRQVIRQGDVQIMSAGTGIIHSEKNKNKDKEVKFLQIWIFPNKKNIKPSYNQQSFSDAEKHNKILTVVSPIGEKKGVEINQNAWFGLSRLDKNFTLNYDFHRKGNGLYVFVLEGDVTINDISLNRRDGLGITETDQLTIQADSSTDLLLMEVPMVI